MNVQQIIQKAEKTNNAKGWEFAGDQFIGVQNFDLAAHSYSKAQNQNPKNPDIYIKLVSCLDELGLHDEIRKVISIFRRMFSKSDYWEDYGSTNTDLGRQG